MYHICLFNHCHGTPVNCESFNNSFKRFKCRVAHSNFPGLMDVQTDGQNGQSLLLCRGIKADAIFNCLLFGHFYFLPCSFNICKNTVKYIDNLCIILHCTFSVTANMMWGKIDQKSNIQQILFCIFPQYPNVFFSIYL